MFIEDDSLGVKSKIRVVLRGAILKENSMSMSMLR